jgi:hypothetical protein
MSVQPPIRPQKGAKIPHDWFGDLYDYIRSLECRGDLQTTTVKRDRSGTVVRAHGLGVVSDSGRTDAIIAQIDTDNADGTYDATEQQNSSGTFSDASTGRGLVFDSGNNGNLYELNGVAGVPVGTYVVVHRVADVSGDPIWYFDSGWGVGTLFPVDLTQTGGVAGDDTTKCSFTYTVDSLSGEELLTAASPAWARPAYGKMVAGTNGVAYYNSAGTCILHQVDEVFDVAVCS